MTAMHAAKPKYTDRWGKTVIPGDRSILKPRSGCFAACISQDRLLITHMPGYDQPELPGGGIDEGETPFEALLREIYEEAGVRPDIAQVDPVFEQQVYFYAEDTDQFLDYHQRLLHSQGTGDRCGLF